jgi:GxxExxY protein
MTRKRQDRLQLLERELTSKIIGAFYECYNVLGFGFLETVYRRSMGVELRSMGLPVAEEVPVETTYKGVCVGTYRLDLLVSSRVIVEVKATSVLGPTDKRQLLNYLRASEVEVGLLLHFGPEPAFHRLVSANRAPLHGSSRQRVEEIVPFSRHS